MIPKSMTNALSPEADSQSITAPNKVGVEPLVEPGADDEKKVAQSD